MRQLIAGNWKMNGTGAEARALAAALVDGAGDLACDLLVCPPATLLRGVGEALAGSAVMLGGQDCHEAASGAFTGDISAAMLSDVGASFVIVGHSERRAGYAETDAVVRAKAEAATAAGLGVIVCVGETEAERDAGNAEKVVTKQLGGSLPPEAGTPGQVTVAYEPIWAIGTGRVPSAADVSAMHRAIRAKLEKTYGAAHAGVRILYGGSVNAGNAAELLHCDEVGGALVGGASLTAESFLTIVSAAAPEVD